MIQQVDIDELYTLYADLAWWYGWTQSDIDALTMEELDCWLTQANRQVKAGYMRV
ncbi:GpE family phage tail protein [Avibacterium paragallinarum]|uniref:GpE family phage tail protein n=1 Tax=Avibacterium paragallinarum TaxID=728 RepID=UPI001CFB0E8D|nr:GpE family phage tail protein [Avibacterium paragallinarum]